MEEFWFRNNDIPIDVQSRLPTKTVLGLKCVSKEWSHLISDRSFVRAHLKRTEPISGFFFQKRFQWCHDDIQSISYIPVGMEKAEVQQRVLDFLPESVVVMALSNGLICCRSCFPSPRPVIYVCNPLQREWVSLQWPTPHKGSSLALVFDTFHYPMDVSTKFKVVRVCENETNSDDEFQFSFDIYSSETGVWRRSREICQCNYNLFKNKSILVGDFLYWLTDGDQVLMFDYSIPGICIGESEGKLHYGLLSEDGLQLWVLHDHFASHWELKHSITLDKLKEENS